MKHKRAIEKLQNRIDNLTAMESGYEKAIENYIRILEEDSELNS